MADEPVLRITREHLQSGSIRQMAVQRNDGETRLATEDELLASRRGLVSDDADCSEIWVFGYGSLIFNPIMDFCERIHGRVYGFHRRFCLWTRLGRGSPDCPGLVLALDRGGSCPGIAFRLKPENAIEELDLLWKREMVTLAYEARWLNLHTQTGIKRAISFVSRPDRPQYASPMSIDSEADVIAAASGFIGPCREYLFDTVAALRDNGITDPHLEKLMHQVKLRLASETPVS